MPILSEANDIFGKKLCDLAELMLEGDIQNEWECQFISDMVDRFEKGWNFTDPQVDKVNELHDKHYI